MVELKALNGCVVQASEDAVPRLLAAGFVHTGETAPLEQLKKTVPKKSTTKKTTTSK